MKLNKYARALAKHAEGLDEFRVAAFFSAARAIAAGGERNVRAIGKEARAVVDDARQDELAALAAAFEEKDVSKALKAEFTAAGLKLRGEERIEIEGEEPARSVMAALADELGSVAEKLRALMGTEHDPDLQMQDDDQDIEINIEDDDDDELDASPADLSADVSERITLAARVAAIENRERSKDVIAKAMDDLRPIGLATNKVKKELRLAARRAGEEGVKLYVETALKYSAREPGDSPDAATRKEEPLSKDARRFSALGHEALEVAITAEREIKELRGRGMNFKMSNAAHMRDMVRRAGHDVSELEVN